MAASRRLLPLAIATVGIVSFALFAWLGYELGRYRAGYALIDVRRTTAALDGTIATQAETIEELERQVAILETAREIDKEAYARVEANLDVLERQIIDQQEQLRFYEGIVSPDDGTAGLRIQDFEVLSGLGERSYTIRLVLVQAIVHNDRVTGNVILTVNGSTDGEPVTLDLATMAGAELADGVQYEFLYFQAVEFPLTLPPGFVAESVDVEVVPERQRDATWTQNFTWPG